MWNLLVVLPCLLLISQVQGSCDQLRACGSEANAAAFFEEDSTLVSYANDALDMDSVCSEVGALTSCINSRQDSCPLETIKQEIEAIRDIIEYLCTPEGRQVALAVGNSECINDPYSEIRMDIMMQSCLSNFQLSLEMEQIDAYLEDRVFRKQDACPFVHELNTCLVNGSRERCGDAMATLVHTMYNIAAEDELSQFGCGLSSIKKRHIMRRAIPAVLKRAALNKKLRK